jgi:transposase
MMGLPAGKRIWIGPVNGRAFAAWVHEVLVPELRPGDIVVMDYLGSHKLAGIAEAIEAVGAQLRYLSAYSPDFNPIEQVFAKLKTAIRKAAARTVETLWSAIGTLLDQFQPAEFERYMQHSGYGLSG